MFLVVHWASLGTADSGAGEAGRGCYQCWQLIPPLVIPVGFALQKMHPEEISREFQVRGLSLEDSQGQERKSQTQGGPMAPTDFSACGSSPLFPSSVLVTLPWSSSRPGGRSGLLASSSSHLNLKSPVELASFLLFYGLSHEALDRAQMFAGSTDVQGP